MLGLLLSALCITMGIVLGIVIVLYGIIRIGVWYCTKFKNINKKVNIGAKKDEIQNKKV